MSAIPSELIATVPDDARPAVERWWSSLADSERSDVSSLLDHRRDACFFSPQRDSSGSPDQWDEMPSVKGGRFLPHDDSVRMSEWLEDWHEYLMGHEEVVLFPRIVIVFRTFRICQGEPEAQEVIRSGQLPSGFQCPIKSPTCQMESVRRVVPNRPLFIAPAALGGWWVVAPLCGNVALSSHKKLPD